MTLCIAWKRNNQIYLASDSRVTKKVGDEYYTTSDAAPKVYSIPLRIYGIGEDNLLYDKDWGFCLAGGYINGSGYANTLSEILSNLQIAPEVSDVSYTNILAIAFKIYEQISIDLVQSGNKEALAKVLITGICPLNEQTIFLYEFGYKLTSQGVDYYSNGVNLDEQYHCIGDQDAIDYFQQNIVIQQNGNVFQILKDVCKNPDLKTVGGNLQTGILRSGDPKHFSLYGFFESELEFDDPFWTVSDKWNFRSIELKPELFEGDIHIRKSFLTPFEDIRNALFDEAHQKNEDGL